MTNVWAVTSQHEVKIAGVPVVSTLIDGIFSSKDKACQVAEKVVRDLEKVHEGMQPPIEWQWELWDDRNGRTYTSGDWDVIVTMWNLDHYESVSERTNNNDPN